MVWRTGSVQRTWLEDIRFDRLSPNFGAFGGSAGAEAVKPVLRGAGPGASPGSAPATGGAEAVKPVLSK